ncbi:glycosyltransferase [Flavobacterium sp.]|jgi:glycosyltransferase involved in cell wall biosynthesis|uniref:glycosyltransferase family protein n=1 Tax=Flavobacterium sp. TaxID=239 RepID=UPI0037BE952B
MKILLLGEYSRLHNSLKEGLVALGHEVKIVGTGDKFKMFPVDYSIAARTCNKYKWTKLICGAIRKLTGFDLEKTERAIRFYKLLSKFNGFDHVQLINSDALETYPFLARLLYKKLFATLKNRSLLICGDETPVVTYQLTGELNYSVLTPYLQDPSLHKTFHYLLKYQKKSYQKTFTWLVENCQKRITSDLDYEIPMRKMGFQTTFIPNPINTDRLKHQELVIANKIVIFLGINRLSYLKKGIPYFEEALALILEKKADKIEIITTENLPYTEYMSRYHKAHIILDQVHAYDQGYNALEAMAQGKVVFTGAENEFLHHYELPEDEVCINALPDTIKIAEKLSYLIEHPEKIIEISKKARNFIEKEHEYKRIAQRYLDCWTQP